MFHFQPVDSDELRDRFCHASHGINEGVLARQKPDSSWVLLKEDPVSYAWVPYQDRVTARCSLWWHKTPQLENHRLGLIGHYFANEAEAGVEILRRACAELAARGCTLAVGPMDGNTWQSYRLITESDWDHPFFLEPGNPIAWPKYFTAAGFTPLAQYFSAATDDLTADDPKLPALAAKLAAQGITIRTLQLDRFEEELHAIYALCVESFRDNFLYTPINETDFLEQYRQIQPVVVPNLFFLAEKDAALIGFLFCIPDYLQKERGEPIDTVIVKTMATHPDYRGTGLGSLLMARCHETARRLGFRRVIHALMHESNHSRKISGHTARIFRRYTLFAQPLENSPR